MVVTKIWLYSPTRNLPLSYTFTYTNRIKSKLYIQRRHYSMNRIILPCTKINVKISVHIFFRRGHDCKKTAMINIAAYFNTPQNVAKPFPLIAQNYNSYALSTTQNNAIEDTSKLYLEKTTPLLPQYNDKKGFIEEAPKPTPFLLHSRPFHTSSRNIIRFMNLPNNARLDGGRFQSFTVFHSNNQKETVDTEYTVFKLLNDRFGIVGVNGTHDPRNHDLKCDNYLLSTRDITNKRQIQYMRYHNRWLLYDLRDSDIIFKPKTDKELYYIGKYCMKNDKNLSFYHYHTLRAQCFAKGSAIGRAADDPEIKRLFPDIDNI